MLRRTCSVFLQMDLVKIIFNTFPQRRFECSVYILRSSALIDWMNQVHVASSYSTSLGCCYNSEEC